MEPFQWKTSRRSTAARSTHCTAKDRLFFKDAHHQVLDTRFLDPQKIMRTFPTSQRILPDLSHLHDPDLVLFLSMQRTHQPLLSRSRPSFHQSIGWHFGFTSVQMNLQIRDRNHEDTALSSRWWIMIRKIRGVLQLLLFLSLSCLLRVNVVS